MSNSSYDSECFKSDSLRVILSLLVVSSADAQFWKYFNIIEYETIINNAVI